jgi:hypothetical protein
MSAQSLDPKAREVVTEVAAIICSERGSAARRKSAELAREVESKLRDQERVDPQTLHEPITR